MIKSYRVFSACRVKIMGNAWTTMRATTLAHARMVIRERIVKQVNINKNSQLRLLDLGL